VNTTDKNICKVKPLPHSSVYIENGNGKYRADMLDIQFETCMSFVDFVKDIDKDKLLNLPDTHYLNVLDKFKTLDATIVDDEVCEKFCSLKNFQFVSSNTELIEKLRAFVKKMDCEQIMKYAKNNVYFLNLVSDDVITEELCTELITHGSKIFLSVGKEKISSFSRKFFDLFASKFSYAVGYIPDKYIDEQMCKWFLDNHPNILLADSRFEKYLTHEICERAISFGGNISMVPKKYLTYEMCILAIFAGHDISSIPTNYRTSKLTEIYTVVKKQDEYNKGKIW
jgi:hypothetical protein